ncbi:MAG: arginine decarboxylase, pyruvoyl-dependent [Firmicutes bacterium]|nr:arginine decarboxylase, pyruvoyl-dependent [Bacillota bacterium]
MLPTPNVFKIGSGAAAGPTPLNAFDNALLASGVGNLNLVRVSSILPPHCEQDQGLVIPPGSLVPTAYASLVCDKAGQEIGAAVAIGRTKDSYGVIMEYSGYCSREQAEATVTEMVRAGFRQRGIEPVEILVRGSSIVVPEGQAACAFACVSLWYR